ncbi:hypothetical protein [uncultured Aquimarina sp.]|uniref:hypothetical protein n=1 Tax=uncultured Aquimarina sp. TaxID=575652 RepID=UPI0026071BB1|nr:hypothetical protein [uncultured Aquimarina sp.]
MNIESTEEVNLKYIFRKLEKAFKAFLRICVSIFQFYKKKWALFLGILIIGFISGYILDSKYGFSKKYTQEIIIEPKYESKKYIYDFVNSLKDNLKEPSFLKRVNLDSNLVKNLYDVKVNPIIKATDVLDNLHRKYGSKEDFHEIIESYDPRVLEKEKYRDFYRYDRLVFVYRTNHTDNLKLSKNILEHIDSNSYFQKILDQNITQTEKNLKENKKTLKYLDDYLEKLNKAPIETDKDLIMIGDESELPTISSLLTRKQTLLNTITNQENILVLNNKLFDVVDRGEIVLLRTGISKKMIIKMPLLLFLMVSFLFAIKKMPSRIIRYINS